MTKKRLLSVPKCRGLLSNNLKVVWISSAAWMRNGEQGKPEDSNQEWNLCEIFLSKWQQSAVKCHKLTVICINRAVNAVMWFVWYIWYVMSCSGARFQWPWIWRALVMKLIQDRPEKSQSVVPSPGAAQLDGHYCIALFFVLESKPIHNYPLRALDVESHRKVRKAQMVWLPTPHTGWGGQIHPQSHENAGILSAYP